MQMVFLFLIHVCSDLAIPLNVGGGRGGLNVLPCARVSTIQLRAFEQYSIWGGWFKVCWHTITLRHLREGPVFREHSEVYVDISCSGTSLHPFSGNVWPLLILGAGNFFFHIWKWSRKCASSSLSYEYHAVLFDHRLKGTVLANTLYAFQLRLRLEYR